ncbi:hypothetical protein ACTPEM_25845, partial [Clostridioides difficile]
VDAMVEAVDKTGLRACLAKSVMDTGDGLPEAWQKTTDEEINTKKMVQLYQKLHLLLQVVLIVLMNVLCFL